MMMMMTMMNQTDIKERLLVMRRQEDSIYNCSDYFQDVLPVQKNNKDNITGIDPTCRAKMSEWSYQVIDFIQFSRETVSISMDYLDRFLCSGCPRAEQVMNCRKEYQLASMTALFMAIKINEPIMIDMVMLTELSKGIYTKEDFAKMETDILTGLNWRVSGPTAQSFVAHLLALVQHTRTTTALSHSELKKIFDLSSYQIELSVGEHKLMTHKSSTVAIASILNCVEACHNETNAGMSSISDRDLLEVISSLDCIQVEEKYFNEVKEILAELARHGPSTMQMRPASSSANSGVYSQYQQQYQEDHHQQQTKPSPHSSVPSTQTQHRVPCAKGDAKDCSPICVSKRESFCKTKK